MKKRVGAIVRSDLITDDGQQLALDDWLGVIVSVDQYEKKFTIVWFNTESLESNEYAFDWFNYSDWWYSDWWNIDAFSREDR